MSVAGASQSFARLQAPQSMMVSKSSQRLQSRKQTDTIPTAEEQRMWDSWNGETELDPSQNDALTHDENQFTQRLHEYELWDGESDEVDEVMLEREMDEIGDIWHNSEQEELITGILEQLSSVDLDLNTGSDSASNLKEPSASDPWFPYPSKLVFLLDTIDNLPRLWISDMLMKTILWLLREAGIKFVPSFSALRQVQKNITDKKLVPTIQWKSPKGNIFSFNDPRSIIANDWSNPRIAKHIHHYPVLSKNGVVSEVWHGQKWQTELDRHLMSPMYNAGNQQHYFIDEPAMLKNNQFVIPVRWLEDEDGAVWFDTWKVVLNKETGLSMILDKDLDVVLIKASELKYNFLDLNQISNIPQWCPETVKSGHPSRIPNPDRNLANGYPMYASFIDVFADDVSGNRSKSWNKHINIYITHRNLPRALLQQQCNIHFHSTSTHASAPEMFHTLKDVVEKTHKNPIKAFWALSRSEICLKIVGNSGPGDNPAQSENCGHIGGGGNLPCRKCKVGGMQVEKETDEGYHAFFIPGAPRSSEDTLHQIEAQINAACLGVAARVKEMQTKTGVKDAFVQSTLEDLLQKA
ncbi:hypothetical protein BJ165DRAFT_1534008 [Panaeolus papilionaceus]|nr:hypothetical protein BJ165DRAFT_1534008 [Panaeolus papilionaceus]